MKSSVQQNFLQFTKPLEGTVNYMYLDVKGLVTVGIGNLIDPAGSASALPFVHNTDNSPASQSEIQAEWTKVKSNAALAQKGYRAAAPPFTTLHLTDAGISQLVTNQLNSAQTTLKQTFTDFENWPADAQLGVLSMAWALGAGFASTWPLFKAACLAQNWAAAAQNCQISTAGNAGVAPRNKADVLLFTNAQAVATQKLDYSVLHWPASVSPAGATDSKSSSTGADGNSTGSKDPANSGEGSGSTPEQPSSDGSAATTTGDSDTTGDNTTSGDDTTAPTNDLGESGTTGDNTTSGDDTTSPTNGDSGTTDSPAAGDPPSDPAGSSSSADSPEGADGGTDESGSAATESPEAPSTSESSDDSATAEPVGASG